MFCPRCGAAQPESAQFCGRCGQTLARRPAPPQAASAAAPPPPAPVAAAPAEPPTAELGGAPAEPAEWPPPPVLHEGLDRRWVGAGIAAALVVGIVVVLLVAGVFSSDKQPQPAAQRAAAAAPTLVAPAATSTPTPATLSATQTATAAATATATAQVVSATVKRTCGVNGSGDCHLSVRAQPNASAAELRRLKEGDTLKLSCQTTGESVHSSALGASSTVWSKTTRGGYVANVYVSGPGLDPQRITLTRC